MTVLTWSGCRNVRDLGGLPTTDGARTRDRALVRADSLTRLDRAGQEALAAYGVSRIVDLRAEHETADPPHPFAGQELYRSVPWVDVDREPARDPSAERGLADIYRDSLDRNVRQVAAGVRAFVEAPPGPVVVHCAGGKDRTGMLVGVLLEAVGVPRAVVVEDYASSAGHLGIAEIVATLGDAERARVETYAWSHPETLTSALEHLDATYGGAGSYLREACGLAGAEVEAVRRRLVG
ncbi:tyrosine-protein phosphatase [Nocardioides panacis]|uniref:Tyrosine-protein phosphatase n=1 Tax=Nocardioides panacis TaxID=2849501 RepID=A0A975T267_9ACTN|nr:tyrosine-protein phosphatase [Nocardioides panacis]QWZ10255.1 tyrosine-protein phosphatase [Nocardioides panacis]